MALIPPAMAPSGVRGYLRGPSRFTQKAPYGVFWRLEVNVSAVECVVQYHVEVDNHSFGSAAFVVFVSHVGAFYVERNAATPRLPHPKEHFVFDLASIGGNHFDGEEVTVPALLTLVRWQRRDDSGEKLGKLPPALVENRAVSIVVETQCQIIRASVSRKAACKAVVAKSYVDAKLLGWALTFRSPFELRRIGAQVFEVINLVNVSKLISIHKGTKYIAPK